MRVGVSALTVMASLNTAGSMARAESKRNTAALLTSTRQLGSVAARVCTMATAASPSIRSQATHWAEGSVAARASAASRLWP